MGFDFSKGIQDFLMLEFQKYSTKKKIIGLLFHIRGI